MVNNYLKIAIDGKEVGLKFANPQAKWFQMEIANDWFLYLNVKADESDLFDLTETGLALIIDTAYRNNCLIKRVEPELTYEQISNWAEGAKEDEAKRKIWADIESKWKESEYTIAWAEIVKKNVEPALIALQQFQEPEKKLKKSGSNMKPSSGRKATGRKK